MLKIEPYAKPTDEFEFAVYSPSTSVTSISGILNALKSELELLSNLEISTGETFYRLESSEQNRHTFATNSGKISCRYLVNSSGFDSVRIAQ